VAGYCDPSDSTKDKELFYQFSDYQLLKVNSHSMELVSAAEVIQRPMDWENHEQKKMRSLGAWRNYHRILLERLRKTFAKGASARAIIEYKAEVLQLVLTFTYVTRRRIQQNWKRNVTQMLEPKKGSYCVYCIYKV
jgi:hypothetical protein